MSGEQSPSAHAGAGQHHAVRLKLTMPSQARQHQHPSPPIHSPDSVEKESSGSPVRPSYSPVTPTLPQASMIPPLESPPVELPPAQWMDEPEPLPVSLDDNVDAIALRAAISALQLQRQQSLRDLRDLDRMKRAALKEPEAFVDDLKAGKLTRPPRSDIEVDDLVDADSSDEERRDQNASKFGQFPPAQNIVRCPPIEWSKYHIVGEPLDQMHEVQKKYPGFDEDAHGGSEPPQPSTIAAPYRPFVDRVDSPRPPAKQRYPGS